MDCRQEFAGRGDDFKQWTPGQWRSQAARCVIWARRSLGGRRAAERGANAAAAGRGGTARCEAIRVVDCEAW